MLIEGDNTDSIMETVRFYQDFGLKRSLTAAEDCQNTALGKKKNSKCLFSDQRVEKRWHRIPSRGMRKDPPMKLCHRRANQAAL